MRLLKVKPKAKHINSLALWSGIIVSTTKNIVKKLISSCSKEKVVKILLNEVQLYGSHIKLITSYFVCKLNPQAIHTNI